jgi:bacteriorhodopsin
MCRVKSVSGVGKGEPKVEFAAFLAKIAICGWIKYIDWASNLPILLADTTHDQPTEIT